MLVDTAQLRVQVKVNPLPEPELLSVLNNRKLFVRYLPSHVVTSEVGLPPIALARITGNIQVERGSRDKSVAYCLYEKLINPLILLIVEGSLHYVV